MLLWTQAGLLGNQRGRDNVVHFLQFITFILTSVCNATGHPHPPFKLTSRNEGWVKRREEMKRSWKIKAGLDSSEWHCLKRSSSHLGLGGIQIVIPSYRPCAILGYLVIPALNTRGAIFRLHWDIVIGMLAMLTRTCKIPYRMVTRC